MSPKMSGLTPLSEYVRENLLWSQFDEKWWYFLNMSWIWAEIEQTESNWELLCIVQTCITQDLIIQHTKVLVSVSIKICWFSWSFLNMSTFAYVLLRQFLNLVLRISFLVIGNNIHLVLNIAFALFWCLAKFHNNGPCNIRLLAIVSLM